MYLKRKVSIFLIIILLVTSFVPATIFASADSNQIGLNAQADNIQTPIEARESAITSINGNENAQDGLLDIKHQTYFWNNNDFADAFSAFLASDDVDLETRITRLVNDLKSAFPAKFARECLDFSHIPMMCFNELCIDGSLEKCLRVLVVINTEKSQKEIHHVYLKGAKVLRADLHS